MVNARRIAVSVLCSIAAIGSAEACDCARRLGAKEAALAFVGVPEIRTEWTRRGRGAAFEMVNYTFTVERTLNGPNLGKAVVTTDTSDCGIPFKVGRRYIVVASTAPDSGIQWFTGQCTETREEPKK